jgi:TPR repeat protein
MPLSQAWVVHAMKEMINMKAKVATSVLGLVLALGSYSPGVQANPNNEKGLGIASSCVFNKDYRGAHTQFEVMAAHGCPYSQCALGIMSQKGVGTKKDLPQAVYWFEKSAQQDFADAENRLGKLYLGNSGLPRNPDLAIHWLKKAALHGVVEAQQELGRLGVTDFGERVATEGKSKIAESRTKISEAAQQGLTKAEQIAVAVPAIQGGNRAPDNDFARGLANIQESWTGYASVAKSLDSANQN